MSEWKSGKIRDLGRVVTGSTPPTKSPELFGDVSLFITPSDLNYDSWRIHKSERSISQAGCEKFRTRMIPAGSIMYTCIASIGKIGIAAGDVLTNQQINSIVPYDDVDGRFVYYLVRNETQRIQNLNAGCAVPIINKGDFENIDVSYPSLPTQKRIADVLSAYDDLIENNRRRMEILEESARLIFKERFEDVWECGKLPCGWQACYVPDCIEVEPEVANPHCDEIRYIPMAALSTSGMTIDVTKAEMRTKATSVRFINGDVLLAGITPCLENGKTGFVNFLEENEVACGSTEFIVLRGRTVSPYFTYCLSRTERFRETAIKSMVGASGRQRVQPECFDTYEIALPTAPILREFDELVEPMFEQIGLLLKQNQDLAEARDMLLPKLTSGELEGEKVKVE